MAEKGEGKKIHQDKFNSLPHELLLYVLSFLSIETKQLVQLSVVSKSWRNTWKIVPTIIIVAHNINVVRLANNLICNNVSEIRKLHLESSYHGITGQNIANWLNFAQRRKVEEVILKDLRCLLSSSIISLVKHLRVLKLSRVCMDGEKFDLISTTLETLELEYNLHNLKCIKIEAPRLKFATIKEHFYGEAFCKLKLFAPSMCFLHFEGGMYSDYVMEDMPSLATAHVELGMGWLTEEVRLECLNKILNRFAYSVRSLTLNASSFQNDKEVPYMLRDESSSFPKLKYLEITNWDKEGCIHALSKILERASNIETLVLRSDTEYKVPSSVKGMEKRYQTQLAEKGWVLALCDFGNLKSVVVEVFDEYGDDRLFIEILLRNAPALESLSITTKQKYPQENAVISLVSLSKKLQAAPRVAPGAVISFQ
ncbi:hypothetical protein ACHQM5_013963 [Ranunculus cassubicifolius]